ncbi:MULTISPECIES: type I secretion system protein LssZ [unclassified Legionella]|uniref:type I secretion system protein LssZ n=1 Tax=unclassified Legionella TaxID=2622702 RepID=UPI0010567DDA|nr:MULTISPECIES: type I secretion system protein LssZ [unclassified Legionella]MDI9818224.1 type I secretion system protein LssZ [Legionella sp. PL877]
MITIMDLIHILLPFVSLIVLVFGVYLKQKNYIQVAFWVSLFALFLHYRIAGGEILGSYFDYLHAAIYSLNLIVLVIALLVLLFVPLYGMENRLVRYIGSFLSAILVTGTILLLINLWINARFVENRLPGTPILQVASFSKQPYCDYKYIFYTINQDKKVAFMCPNHYGLIPSVGELPSVPDFITKQLPSLEKKLDHSD